MITTCAVVQVSRTFKVGLEKVRQVNDHWWAHEQSYKTTGTVRGKVTKKDNRRRRLTQEQDHQLREFINDEHKAVRAMFSTVRRWIAPSRQYLNTAVGCQKAWPLSSDFR